MKRYYILVLIAVLIGCEITNLPDREEEGSILIPVTIGGGPFGDTDVTDAVLPEEGRFGSRVKWTEMRNGYPQIKSLLAAPVWITHRLGNSFQPYENAGQVTDERRGQILVNLKRTPSLVQVHGLPGENRFSIKIEDYMRQNSWQVIGIGLTKAVPDSADVDVATAAMLNPVEIEAFVDGIVEGEAIWFAFDPVFWNEYYNRRRSGTVHVELNPACATSTPLTECGDTVATLRALTLSDGATDVNLTPTPFDSATTGYNASVGNSVASVTVTATTTDSDATLTIDGASATSGVASGAITLNAGGNTQIAIVVTTVDTTATETYTITVTRSAPEPDSAGITVVATDATTDESGGTATITVRLNTQPTANVVVTPTSSDTDEGTVNGALTFSTSNWNTAQTITVTGVDDSLVDGDKTYQISFAVASTDSNYDEFTPTPVEITNSDDDYSATIETTTQAAEPSTDGVFTISLDRNAPTGGVTVDYDITGSATAGDDYATLPVIATIAAGSSTGTVVVDVTDDSIDDDAETVVLTLTGGSAGSGTVIVGGPSATATVTITDDDSAGITVSGISGATSESGETATISVHLNTQPTADVTVTPTSSDTDEGTVSGALTFSTSNWGTAKTITVTGMDDTAADGNQTYQISFAVASADGDYNDFTLTPVEVTNSDDDSAGITVVATDDTTDESGDTATFTVRLNTQPSADVTVTPDSSDTGEGTVSGALTFSTSNWGMVQTITVTGVDDDTAADGNQTYQITFAVTSTDSNYDGFTLTPVDVTNSAVVAFERIPSRDFTTLDAAGNNNPVGLWSNGTTMWVANRGSTKIYAYKLSTKERDTNEDFDNLLAAGNTDPQGLWSNGTTMWVSDAVDGKIYAYNRSTKAYNQTEDFDTLNTAGNNNPQGIWSDGTTMWVADVVDDKIYAYNLLTKSHDTGKNLNTLAAGNDDFFGLWSDRTTMWVSDYTEDKIFAYNLSNTMRDPSKDFTTLIDAENESPQGIWSDGTTMWVADSQDNKIFAYRMPTPTTTDS